MRNFIILLSGLLTLMFSAGCTQQKELDIVEKKIQNIKRIGMVIGMKPEMIEKYKAVHADSNPGVRDLLTKYNMENFSIFIHKLDDGNHYLFGYYEYTGDDFDKDMAVLAKEQRNIEWLKMCDPMQKPLKGQTSWSEMERVYYNP